MITVAENGNEWHDLVGEQDRYRCASKTHVPACTGAFEHAHHICYKSQIPEHAYNVVENGIALSDACHTLAHKTHNESIGYDRANAAVRAVNHLIVGKGVKVKPFRKKAA